eukprot:604233-Karenia_brevis.AAC.1
MFVARDTWAKASPIHTGRILTSMTHVIMSMTITTARFQGVKHVSEVPWERIGFQDIFIKEAIG